MTRTDFLELQRKDVFEFLKILDCKIHIQVKDDLRTAKYKFCYSIKVLKQGLNYWREIFDYNKDDVKVIGARDSLGGLKDETSNNGKYTTVKIEFRDNPPEGSMYHFEYEVETRIESISNIHRILGGKGAIWYWCSHEFEIESLTAVYKLPHGIFALQSHPLGEFYNNTVSITKTNLTPNEFFSGIIQVEKKVFGLNSSWGNRLYQLLLLVVGAFISLGITELINYLKPHTP